MPTDKCDVPHCTNKASLTKKADHMPFAIRVCAEHHAVWRPWFVPTPVAPDRADRGGSRAGHEGP